MYRIINGESVLATLANPTWVKMQDNGSYAICPKEEAHGIALDGAVYHIEGTPELAGVETVVLTEISEVSYQKEQQATMDERQLQTETALAELSILIASGLTGV